MVRPAPHAAATPRIARQRPAGLAARAGAALLAQGLLTVTGALADAGAPAGTPDQPDFCEQLPRPEWLALQPEQAGDGWFETAEVEPGIWAIYEPHQWQEVISYLILGSQSALLFDTGNGIGDIRGVVAELTDKPVRVLNSHSHYDHVGGNHQFTEILSPMTAFSRQMQDGLPHAAVADEVSPAALCRALPAGSTADAHALRPYTLTASVADGDVIDLGDRQLEVLLTPGHTPDSLALLDREHGLLWTGDSFYEGPIWLFAPETDLADYRASMHRLAELAPDLSALLPSHNTPRAAPQRLEELSAAIDAVLLGRVAGTLVSEGQREFSFGTFSLLVSEEQLRAVRGEPRL